MSGRMLNKLIRTEKLKIVVSLLFVFSGMKMKGQDVHFSQFYSTPLLVNPAMTGIFDGKVRISNNYRTQWSGAGKGYSTFHISGDLPLGKDRYKNNFFGAGLMIYQDKAGDAAFTNTIIEGALSYTTSLDEGDNFVAIGFRGGIDSRELDLAKATWDDQWTGDVFNPVEVGESLPFYHRTYFDFTAGLMWYYVPDGKTNVSFGGSVAHLSKPDFSFTPDAKDILNNRIAIHGSADLSMDPDASFWVCPKLFAQFQGKQKEMLAGAFLRNRVEFKSKFTNFRKDMFFNLGAWIRLSDALIIASRFEYNDWGLGISYDFTTSELGSLLGAGGGPEFTLSYVMSVQKGQRSKNINKTPKFF